MTLVSRKKNRDVSDYYLLIGNSAYGKNESRMYWNYNSVGHTTGFFNTKFSAFNCKFSYGKYPPPAFTAAQKSLGHKLPFALVRLFWCYCKFKIVIFYLLTS